MTYGPNAESSASLTPRFPSTQEAKSTQADVSITTNEWILVSSGDYSGLYKVTITHNLNSTNLIMAIYENGIESMVNITNIVNSNSIDIYNDEAINCKIVINSGSSVSSSGEIKLKPFSGNFLT